jgi:hypothetical protein
VNKEKTKNGQDKENRRNNPSSDCLDIDADNIQLVCDSEELAAENDWELHSFLVQERECDIDRQ